MSKSPSPRLNNVTAVPLAAVFTEKNPDTGQMERFVYVQQGETFEKRNVKVGVSDYTCAEIQEGLKPGEVVSLELPKEERDKKAKQVAVQKKSGGDTGTAATKPPAPASGTHTNSTEPPLPAALPPTARPKAARRPSRCPAPPPAPAHADSAHPSRFTFHASRPMPLVELRNVSKIYRLGEEEIRALDDVTLDIGEGEFISIIGPHAKSV